VEDHGHDHDRRSEDSYVRIWAPIVVPLLGIAVAWGSMSNQLNGLEINQVALVKEVRELRDGRISNEGALRNLEHRVASTAISSEVVGDLAARIGSLESTIAQHEVNFRQVWPRLRAAGANVEILRTQIETTHPEVDIQLKNPEPF